MHDALAVATPTTNKECANASHRSNNKERQNFPFSLTGTDADRISAKVKTFPRLGTAKLLLWALLKSWLFEPQRLMP
jgi:hypothetical protein